MGRTDNLTFQILWVGFWIFLWEWIPMVVAG